MAFLLALNLFSCSSNSLNQISEKKIKNEITGEVEEYRVIKISEDAENDYFLEVRLPGGYEESETQFGDFLTVYRFSVGEANRYSHKGIMISHTYDDPMFSHKKSLENFKIWLDSVTKESGEGITSETTIESHKKINNNSYLKSHTISYVVLCKPDRSGSICFDKQKAIEVKRLFQGKNMIWIVEYKEKISPFNNGENDYDKVVERKLELAKDVIRNCCEISAVKKMK